MSDAARTLPEAESALPPGTRLSEFEIRSLLGVGGFGIVYLAFDHALEREVAVKEYMPASMAGRTETMHVSLRSQSDAEVFGLGLRSFVNEAKLLARFDHPSLIKVHRFWEANGTAYMAMPVLRGRTLRDIRKATGRGPDEAWIRSTLVPLLGALEHLHNEGVYHRDIAPDNIHLEAEGRPVLLDFGAARRVISGKTQTLTAILKPAYAPIEQYGETGAVKQGAWTDIYALGATLHYMLLGYPPPPATARTVADESSGLTVQALPGVSPQMLAIIDWMLAPRPSERPQSVAELRAALEGHVVVPKRAAPPAPAPTPVWDKTAMTASAPVTIPLGDVAAADLEFDIAEPPAPPPVPRATEVTRLTSSAAPSAATSAAHEAQRLRPPSSPSSVLPWALVGVMSVAVAGYFGWTKFGPGSASAAAPAASVAPTAEPATAPMGAPPSVTAPAPVSTSVVAVPIAAAASGAASEQVPVGPGIATSPTAAPESVPAPARGARTGTGTRSAAAVTGTAASPTVGAASPSAAPVAASGAEPGPGATPEARCVGRNPLSHFVCMERECLRGRFKNHPECLSWRQQARPRDAIGN